MRRSRTIFFFLICTLFAGSALAAIVVTPTVTPITAEVYDGSLQLTYNGIITVTATGGTAPYTYTLTGTSSTTPAVNNPFFPGVGPGTYTLAVTDATGQTASATVTVGFLYAQPSLSVSSIVQPSLCSTTDGGFTLNAGGGTPPYTYSIDGGLNYTTTSTYINLSGGTYYVSAKDVNGQVCVVGSNPTSATVGVISLSAPFCMINPVISTMIYTCGNGGSMQISVTSTSPPVKFSLDGTNYWSLTLNPAIPNTYYYDTTGLAIGLYNTVTTDATGNITRFAVSLTQFCLPDLSVFGQPATCHHSDGKIIALAGYSIAPYSFTLDGVNYQSSGTFTGLPFGYYNILVKDGAGQTSSATVLVGGNCPIVTATATPETCNLNDGSITATADLGFPVYQWSIDGVNFQYTNIFTGLKSGNYTVTIRDMMGVTSTCTVTVPNTCIPIGVSVNATVVNSQCDNNSGSITGTAGGRGTPPYTYSIDGTNFQTSDLFSGLGAGIYTLTIKDAATLTGTSTVTVAIDSNLTVDAGSDHTICDGASATLTATSNGTIFSWSPGTGLDNPGALDPTAAPPTSTKYYLTATLGVCSRTDSVIITVTQPKLSAGDDSTVLIGEPVLLHAIDVNNSGFDSYTWSPATGLNNPSIQDPIATPAQSTTYTVLASTPDGCSGSASVTIKVYTLIGIFVPSAFTPNGDGHNDILRAIPLGIKTFNYFSIFNRAGQRIFFTANPSLGWDGAFNGQPQNTGVYVWITAGTDLNGHLIKRSGTVILIR